MTLLIIVIFIWALIKMEIGPDTSDEQVLDSLMR